MTSSIRPPIPADRVALQHRDRASWLTVATTSLPAGEKFLQRAANPGNWRLRLTDGRVLTAGIPLVPRTEGTVHVDDRPDAGVHRDPGARPDERPVVAGG